MRDPREQRGPSQLRKWDAASGHDFTWARDSLSAASGIPNLVAPLKRLLSSWTRTLNILQRWQLADLRQQCHPESERSLVETCDVRNEAFTDLVGAYRRFLLGCCRCVSSCDGSGRPALPSPGFEAAFIAKFPRMADSCWTGDEMRMYRAIRLTLRHNDDDSHTRLDQWKGRVRFAGGQLFLDSLDNYRLYRALRTNVERLVAAVIRHPKPSRGRFAKEGPA